MAGEQPPACEFTDAAVVAWYTELNGRHPVTSPAASVVLAVLYLCITQFGCAFTTPSGATTVRVPYDWRAKVHLSHPLCAGTLVCMVDYACKPHHPALRIRFYRKGSPKAHTLRIYALTDVWGATDTAEVCTLLCASIQTCMVKGWSARFEGLYPATAAIADLASRAFPTSRTTISRAAASPLAASSFVFGTSHLRQQTPITLPAPVEVTQTSRTRDASSLATELDQPDAVRVDCLPESDGDVSDEDLCEVFSFITERLPRLGGVGGVGAARP